MNRRSFLRFLGLVPVALPVLAKEALTKSAIDPRVLSWKEISDAGWLTVGELKYSVGRGLPAVALASPAGLKGTAREMEAEPIASSGDEPEPLDGDLGLAPAGMAAPLEFAELDDNGWCSP